MCDHEGGVEPSVTGPFMRDIAALGVAYLEDVTHGDESMLHATMRW